MKTAIRSIQHILLLLALLLPFAGCSGSGTSNDGTGSITARLQWGAGKTVAKTVAAAPAGVATVRIIVSGSGMTSMQSDFAASAGTGSISNVPAGSGITITAHGLDGSGTLTHQGSAGNITVQPGETTDAGTITMLPVAPTTPPAAPSGLSATVNSAFQISLGWTDNATDETGFKIERKIGSGGVWSQIGTTAANTTMFGDSDLSPSTTYFYRVRATNSAGDSAYTSDANATTQPTSAVTDDFSGDLSKWTTFSDGGRWSISNGVLNGYYTASCGSAGCTQSDIILKDQYQPTTSDWSAEVTTQHYTYDSSLEGNRASFSLYAASNNKMDISVGGSGNNFNGTQNTINVNVQTWNGSWTYQPSWSKNVSATWDASASHKVRLTKSGHTYAIYFDGTLIHSFTENFFTVSPKIGLHVYTAVAIDDINIMNSSNSAYTDDFTGDLSKWTTFSDGGRWSISNGVLNGYYTASCGSPGCTQSDIILKDQYQPTTSDWSAEVTTQHYTYNSSLEGNRASFSLYAASNNKMDISVGGSGNNFNGTQNTINVNVQTWNGSWSYQASWSKNVSATWDASASHKVRLTKSGHTYSIYFDGNLIHSFIENFFTVTPKIGLHVYTAVAIDDIKIFSD